MSNERPWQLSISRYPFVGYGTREGTEEDRLLSRAGYRGPTQYGTKEDARDAADRVLTELVALDPTVGWMAVWCFPYVNHPTNVEGEAECHWMRRDPNRDEEKAEPGAARMKLPNKQVPWAIGEDGEVDYYDPEFLPD